MRGPEGSFWPQADQLTASTGGVTSALWPWGPGSARALGFPEPPQPSPTADLQKLRDGRSVALLLPNPRSPARQPEETQAPSVGADGLSVLCVLPITQLESLWFIPFLPVYLLPLSC